ncbi:MULTISPECIES: Flp family type IVb pilin [unclassified Aureimonas]|uniref:Flp family type IVb pilin n=1 Tax=unclassified Aureimonas TaxID=2615206 RepID=UPI0009E86481|nr:MULTISPECIES: Flp family type IVb pilin [unclassified Aureimonas]
MSKLIARFARNESGATAIEYGLIAALMSVAVIAAFPTLKTALSTTFSSISTTMGAVK